MRDLGGGRGMDGGSPILAIEKGSTSQEMQQAISVGNWEWKEIWGGGGGTEELYIVNAQAEPFLTPQDS